MILAGGLGGTVAPTPSDLLSAGLTHTVDRTLALPASRRVLLSLQADQRGYEAAAGYRLWSKEWGSGALAAWAGASWDSWWDPMYGARFEMRF